MIDDKMQIARGRLGLYAGFWLALAAKMQWVAGNASNTPGGVAATDGRRVWYNRDDLNARSIGEVVFIALHEIGHPMLCHLTRRGSRNPKIYGAAIDIVLNKLLKKIAEETTQLAMEVPKDALFGAAFGIPDAQVTTVEHVYELLLKKCKEAGGKSKGKGGDPGNGMPTFDVHLDPTNEDGTPMSGAQAEANEKDWRVSVQAAAVMAKQMGKLPGFMEEFIGELLAPKVDWKSHLWMAVSRMAKDESSYRRFNRRHISRGIYMPGMYSERIGAVGYFVDTSGSISTEEFKQAMGEMTYLLEELKPERIFFGQCDTKLHRVDELTPEELPLPALHIYGRGGTDMREAFAWACEHEAEIDAFILQTDGYVPALDPDLMPNCPVIIIKTTDAVLPPGWDFPTVIEVRV